MNPQMRNQILIGFLAGALLAVLTWFLLAGKRTELEGLNTANDGLRQEVVKGNALKANYEKLKKEVDELQRRIDELIKIMPTDMDRGDIPYRVKKLADTAGIEQVSFKLEGPVKKEYYTEHPVSFRFKAGYHTFGQFASLVSGFDKIINLSEMQFSREPNRYSIFPASVTCRISAFVYNPAPPPAPPAAKKPAAPAAAQAEKD